MKLRSLFPLALPFITTTAAFAQVDALDSFNDDAPAPAVADVMSLLSGVFFDAPGNGTIYARGDSWKAEFGPRGAVYVPNLGADAPRNFPVRFRLASATVGGSPVRLADNPEVRREENRVIIDHGPILEVYDVADDSVEQSFILPSRENAGEIVVRMDVESDLVGETAGRGLRFAGEFGGVNYGEAFAFDHAGRTADVESRLDGQSLELRVPATFPADGELVIDPIMTSFSVAGQTGQRLQQSDIAFNKNTAGGVYLVVWEREFSATDHDVYSAEIVKSTGEVRLVSAIDLSQDDYRHPKVAGNNGTNAFMTVCEVYPENGGGLSDIVARLRAAGNSFVGGPIFVNSAPGNSECFTPDIGGDSVTIPGAWCVVYAEDIGAGPFIRAQLMSGTGAPIGFPRIVSTGTSNSDPAISENTGDDASDRRWNVAWTRTVSAFNVDVEACQIAPASNGLDVVTPRFSLGYITSQSKPAVSSMRSTPLATTGERPWAVASTITAQQGDDLLLQLVSGGQLHATQNITHMEGDEFTDSYRDPAVGCAGNSFILTYASKDISGGDAVFMNTFYAPDTAAGTVVALAERRKSAGTTNNGDAVDPQLVTDWEGGLFSSDEGMMSFTYELASIGGHHIRAAAVEAYGTTAIGSQYCTANRNSTNIKGWLAVYGSNSAGTTQVALGYDLPVGQTAFMLCSLTAGSVNNPGGSEGRLCLGGQIGRLYDTVTTVLPSGTALFLIDSGELATPAGTVAAQAGQTWHFQAWHRDFDGGVGTSNFTNGARVNYL